MRSTYLLAGSLLAAMGSLAEANEDDHSIRERVARVASIASGFIAFAGSEDNAVALVEALREGAPVRLTYAASKAHAVPEVIVIEPPTGPMDWDDVRMTLILARDALTAVGVMRPTSEQLYSVLLGGQSVVPGARMVAFKGVLRMRADGQGWGRIASERFQRAAVTRLD